MILPALFALAVSAPHVSINTAHGVDAEPIVSITAANPVWRIYDRAHGVVCYLILAERGGEAPPVLTCLRRMPARAGGGSPGLGLLDLEPQ